MAKVLKLPMKGQWYDFDCGVAVAWSMLKYCKIKTTYEAVLKASKICPVSGLKPTKLITLLRKFGLKTTIIENSNIRQLKKQINLDRPAIVIIQIRKENKKPWKNSWKHGHYCIIFGCDDYRVFIYDPSMGGSVKIFTYEQFNNRWHDCNDDGEIFNKTVIIIDNENSK